MIAIIDYGLGNLRSVSKAFEKIGQKVEVTSSVETLQKAKALILPGVGAFSKGMENLQSLNILPTVSRLVAGGKPLLGICLGLQLFFNESSEHRSSRGLGFIEGKVEKFRAKVKLPHMGWNRVEYKDSELFDGIPKDNYFYFVHSYYVQPEDKNIIVGRTVYQEEFSSVIVKDNIVGVQFHPEKSDKLGLKFLENFIKEFV